MSSALVSLDADSVYASHQQDGVFTAPPKPSGTRLHNQITRAFPASQYRYDTVISLSPRCALGCVAAAISSPEDDEVIFIATDRPYTIRITAAKQNIICLFVFI